MTLSPFIEPLPSAVDKKLRSVKPSNEQVLIQVANDVAEDLTFAERWLVVTERRVLLLTPSGVDSTVDLPLYEITAARLEGLIGGGRLVLERNGCAPIFLYVSNSSAPKFAEVADGIRQLSRGEPLLLPTVVERTRCPKCRMLLPQKHGICPVCADKRDTVRRITGYLRPYRYKAALLILIMVVGTGVELLPPVIIEHIIDDVLTPQANFGLLIWLVLALLGVRILSWLSEVGRGWLSVWLGGRITTDIRGQLYRHLQYLPLRFYDNRPVGMLMSRIIKDTNRLEEFLANGVPLLFINGVMLVGILGFLFYTSWVLTLYVLLPVLPIALVAFLIWDHLRRAWERQSASWARLSTHFDETLSGIRVVKAFSQEQREAMRFDQRNDELLKTSMKAERRSIAFFTVIYFLMSLGIALAWYIGGRQVLYEELTVGELSAIVAYLWMLYWPLQWIGQVNNSMAQAVTGAKQIFEILDTPPEAYQDPNALPLPHTEGRVTFRQVTFGYDPSKPVLHDLNLDVAPGETIGLVGKSGAGKTTMMNLLCRFYDVDRGSIEVDGVDIRQLRLEDLRNQIGIVLQEPFLFSGTIAEDISYGRPGASFEELVQAAKVANAHAFILAKPDGYDTEVGEHGHKLSGGEKQRIALARAVLCDPKLLILDEATSSLDAQNERLIQQAIDRLAKYRTTFIIAHRLSTVRNVDRLVVLDAGRVVEVGSYEELLARQGVFYKLIKTQREMSAVMA